MLESKIVKEEYGASEYAQPILPSSVPTEENKTFTRAATTRVLAVAFTYAFLTTFQVSAFSISLTSLAADLQASPLQSALGISTYGWVSIAGSSSLISGICARSPYIRPDHRTIWTLPLFPLDGCSIFYIASIYDAVSLSLYSALTGQCSKRYHDHHCPLLLWSSRLRRSSRCSGDGL